MKPPFKALALILLVSLSPCLLVFSQTAGQFNFPSFNTTGGATPHYVTPENNKAFGINSSGVPAMLSVSGGSSSFAGLSDVALTSLASGDFIKYNGTAWINVNAAAARTALGLGTLATQSATISDYLTSATAATTYQPLSGTLTTLSSATAAGLALMDDANAAAQRTTLGLGTLATQSATISDYLTSATAATTYQPLSAPLTTLSSATAAGLALMDDANAAAQRTTLGLGTLATLNEVAWNLITDSPATFTSGVDDIAGGTGGVHGFIIMSGGDGFGTAAGGLGGTIFLNGAPSPNGTTPGGNGGNVQSNGNGIFSGGTLDMTADSDNNGGNITTIEGGSLTMGTADLAGGSVAGTILTTTGNGSGLTALNASNISSGTVATARLGSGTANAATFLRGDNTWAAAGAGTVTSVAGAGTVSGLTLTGTVTSSGSITLGGALTGVAPSAITGTAAILGANTFTGAQTLTPSGGTSTTGLTLNGRMVIASDGVGLDLRIGAAGMYLAHVGNNRINVVPSSGSGAVATFWNSGEFYIATGGIIAFRNGGSPFGSESDGVFQFGLDHATTASAQAIKGHDVTTGTGGSINLRGGNGSTAGGAVTISTSPTTTPTERVRVSATGEVFLNLPTSAGTTGSLWNDGGTVKVAP